ncbi:MAG: response regulator transcription factor [Eubacteriales bacterium]
MADESVKILIVDDEENIVQFLKLGLTSAGYEVITAADGAAALRLVHDESPGLVVLDVMLPVMSGFEVCREIRKISNAPVIMLTAKDDVDDRVTGLNIGADDYMVKPFSFKELLARIQARLRSRPGQSDKFLAGPFRIDDLAHEITFREQLLSLSLTEYRLLKYFLTNPGIVLSKKMILDQVWGYDFYGEDNIVEVYVRYLRNKLGENGHQIIHTVRGLGYKAVIK